MKMMWRKRWFSLERGLRRQLMVWSNPNFDRENQQLVPCGTEKKATPPERWLTLVTSLMDAMGKTAHKRWHERNPHTMNLGSGIKEFISADWAFVEWRQRTYDYWHGGWRIVQPAADCMIMTTFALHKQITQRHYLRKLQSLSWMVPVWLVRRKKRTNLTELGNESCSCRQCSR